MNKANGPITNSNNRNNLKQRHTLNPGNIQLYKSNLPLFPCKSSTY